MISAPCLLDFRAAAGPFLMCMTLLLSGCERSTQRPGSQDTPSSNGTLQYSATLSYEDRQMMRRYLVQELYDGIIDIAEMQARIGRSHDYSCSPNF